MRFIFITVIKELKRRFNDPGGLISAILIPFAIGFLIASVMGGSGGASIKAELLVTDLDDSFISQGILSALGQDQVAEMILLEKVSLEEGDRRINEGDGSAHLIIPEGFGDAWLDREAIALKLTVNPSQYVSPRLIREMLESLLDLGDYLHKVFGDELKIISNSLDSDDLVGITTAEFSADITDKVSGIADLVFPPVIEVEDVTPKPEGSGISMALLMFPGILIMAAFFGANGQSSNYWTEREKGTLGRWVASPNAFSAFWIAQWFTAMLLTAIVAAPIMLFGFFYLDISFEKYFASLAWLTLTGPILFALLSLIQVLAPSRKAGTMISTLLMFPLLMVGGSFFPTETMPKFISSIAQYTPNGRVVEPLKGYLTGEYGSSTLFSELWVILVVALLLVLLTGSLSARKVLA
ncbi:MAG: ABC transporter permease [Gammaproteobacteria bacterium]|nr:ABC transporter permease [Gammaproteobacteria bacterium]